MMENLRTTAMELLNIGLAAANPETAVRRALAKDPSAKPTHILAVGKAASAMMRAALSTLDGEGRVQEALVVTVKGPLPKLPAYVRVFIAGHPRPEVAGLNAAQAVTNMVTKLGAQDHLLVLISGGGSALLPAPLPGISLKDKQAANDLMLAGGLGIEQINLVRQNLSELKGGGLAQLAWPAQVRALILSDVIGNDLRAVASGPTTSPLGTAEEARQVLQAARLWEAMPASVQLALNTPPKQTAPRPAQNELVGSNAQSLHAMAEASGGTLCSDTLIGDVEDAADQIVAHIRTCPDPVLLWGGETTVKVTGTGRGGRNQELALHVLSRLQDHPSPWIFMSVGSDGIDGPTDAAGGLVHSELRLSPDHHTALRNNDAYAILKDLDALLILGPTGTNVADFQMFLRP